MGDDEAIVRASAVRALAIFVMFPSLKEGIQYEQRNIDLRPTQIAYIIAFVSDICYIENTAEAIVKLMQDENLSVRIKSSWALANITDVLVVNM